MTLCYIVWHYMQSIWRRCSCKRMVMCMWPWFSSAVDVWIGAGAEFPRHCNPHCFLLYHVLPCFTSVLPCTMFVSYFYHCFTLCHSCFIAFNTLHTITSQFTQLQLCIVLLYRTGHDSPVPYFAHCVTLYEHNSSLPCIPLKLYIFGDTWQSNNS